MNLPSFRERSRPHPGSPHRFALIRQTQPCPAVPRRNLPCRPFLATTCQAAPRRAQPRHACLVVSRHARPRRGSPRTSVPALPCYANPRLPASGLNMPCLPRHAQPINTPPSMRRTARTIRAQSCLPCLPRKVSLCLAAPFLRSSGCRLGAPVLPGPDALGFAWGFHCPFHGLEDFTEFL